MALTALRREVRLAHEGRRGSVASRGPGQRHPSEDADRVWAARALGIGWILGAGGLVVARQSLSGADSRFLLTILTAVAAAVGGVLLIRRADILRGARLDAVLLMTTSTVGLAAVAFPADPATLAVSVVLTVPFACSLLPVVRAWLHAGYVVLVAAVVVGLSARAGELGPDVAGLRLLQLTALVGIVGLVVRRLTVRARRRTRIAEAVAAFGHRALTVTEPDELLSKALRVAVDVIGADYGTALRRLPDGRSRVAAELGRYPIAAGSILPDPPAGSYARQIMQSGQAFVSVDLRHDRRITPPLPLLRRGIVSGLAVPVLGSRGTLGVLALHSRERRQFTRDEIAAATALAGVVATAWEQAAQRETLTHQAMHDALTGLPNRALFLDRLDLALSRRLTRGGAPETETTVMLIDLDNFKRVNDSLGHLAGDELLATVARRLLGAVRPEDTVARLGGDEFAVLCTKTEDEHAAGRLLARLQAVLAEPIVAAGVEVSVTACVGVTMGHRLVETPATGRALLGEADAALYIAKQEGRGRSRHFDERLQVQARQRLQLETDLRHAIDHGEFVLHYQPIRSVADHHVLGVEALVRWQHPQRGLVPPDEFIPVAEQTGLIVPLGQWVLHTAAAQVARWQRSGSAYEALWVSVNVSPRQLDDPDLPAQVAAVLQSTGLRAGSLSLELTETALLEDGTGLAALTALRDAGARLVLDDFGTGYSSLTHLTRFPIEAVKIDRTFVAGLGTNARDSAVVAAVITLGAQLDMKVVAEGVETPRQLTLLSQAGCYAVQGFLMDRPSLHPRLDTAPLESQPAGGMIGGS